MTDPGDLAQLLDQTEAKAWRALRHYRFAEFAHYAELWASLHRISGEKRKNPFRAVVAAAPRVSKPSKKQSEART